MLLVHTFANDLLSGILMGGVLALIALGLSVVLGVMRLINLAHGTFLTAGAYVGFILSITLGLGPLVSLPLIALIVALIAWPMQRLLLAPIMRRGEESPMMTTLAISLILENLYLYFFSADTRSIGGSYTVMPLSFWGMTVPLIQIIGFFISIIVFFAVQIMIRYTALGRDLRASAVDPVAASSVGVNVKQVHAISFALGAACAAVGGVLIGAMFSFTPSTGSAYLLTSFAVVVMGGMGNIMGTFMAGILLGVLQSIGAFALGDGYRELIGLVVFLVVLAFRPTGLFSRRA